MEGLLSCEESDLFGAKLGGHPLCGQKSHQFLY